jgi:hypothetical protein
MYMFGTATHATEKMKLTRENINTEPEQTH